MSATSSSFSPRLGYQMRLPPLLAPGARVALVAPSGPLNGEHELQHAVENARSFGWEVWTGQHVVARRGYLAGTDAERLEDLNRALTDPAIDGVWCVRGGYGAMRLLERVDYAALRDRPKALIGFSDVTALHAALLTQVGLGSFHGPTARQPLSAFSRESLERAVVRGVDSCGTADAGTTLHGGRVRGTLVAGNLALLAALAGTPFAPTLDGAVLVVEDVNEEPYRVDRMLTQLMLTGALERCAGLVFGAFTDGGSEDAAAGFDALFRELAATLQVPCLAGVPVGHIDDQWTLPVGAVAELDADARRLTVHRNLTLEPPAAR